MNIAPKENDILIQDDIDTIIKEQCFCWQEPAQARTTVALCRSKIKRFCQDRPGDAPSFLVLWSAQMISWITEYEQMFTFPHACHMHFDSWKEWLADQVKSRLDSYAEESGWETNIEALKKGLKVLDLRPFIVWDFARKVENDLMDHVSDSMFDLLRGDSIGLVVRAERVFNEAMESIDEKFLG